MRRSRERCSHPYIQQNCLVFGVRLKRTTPLPETRDSDPIDLADSSPYTKIVWVKALRPKRTVKVPCRKAQSLVTISSFSRSQCKCKSSKLPKSRHWVLTCMHGHRGSWKRFTEAVILSVFLRSVVLSCASALLTCRHILMSRIMTWHIKIQPGRDILWKQTPWVIYTNAIPLETWYNIIDWTDSIDFSCARALWAYTLAYDQERWPTRSCLPFRSILDYR